MRRGSSRLAEQQRDAKQSDEAIQDAAAFIDYVRSLPEEEHTDGELVERPSKRARSSEKVPSITIARRTLSLKQTASLPSSATDRIIRRDVGRHLKFSGAGQAFFIKPTTTKGVNFELHMPLDPDPSAPSLPFDRILATQSCDPELEGCIWAAVDVVVFLKGSEFDITLDIEVKWSETRDLYGTSKLRNKQKDLRDQVSNFCLPIPVGEVAQPTLQTFYDGVCAPETDLPSAHVPQLSSQLYPFQRKSVQWLLNREGVQWSRTTDSEGVILEPYRADPSNDPISFHPAKDADDNGFTISPLFGVVTTDTSPFQPIKGGILAEEMGLGKTLEIISLILLHRRSAERPEVFDPYLGRQLPVSKGTLIVTPPSLLDQWIAEIGRHAPGLKIMQYSGLPSMASGKRDEKAILDRLLRHDVVVTTYDVLRAEVHAAMEPPARSMRRDRAYERPKSPLVEISWWRVCIDEAQMVETRNSNVAVMARLIPRVNAWAITGTPVKDNLQEDLRGLLAFLRYEPYASDNDVWKRLFTRYPEYFTQIFNLICLRHTKSQVRSEIELPPQKRYVITMSFSAVEEQNYQNVFEMYTHACGLDVSGSPLGVDWNPDDPATQQKMREALDQLRQVVLQPGPANGRRLGRKEGPLRTLTDVLDAMLDQSESRVRTMQRAFLSMQLIRGEVLATLGKTHDALDVWEQVFKKSATIVDECRKHLQEEIGLARAKAKEIPDGSEGATHSDDDGDDDVDDEDLLAPRVSEARRRLRHALEIQHKAVFFCANAYFSIKSDESKTPADSEEFQRLEKLEVEYYDTAKSIRKEILQEAQGKAKKLMGRLAEDARKQSFATIPQLESKDEKGIESRRILEDLELLYETLDDQAGLLDEWREHVIQLLLKPLVDEETGEITGEEYEQSAKLSEEIVVYVQAVRTVLADRYQLLSGQHNILVEHEFKTSVRQAKEGDGPCPEKLLELAILREQAKPGGDPGQWHSAESSSFRGVITQLRNLAAKLQVGAASGNQRSATELAIVTHQLKLVGKQLADQTKANAAMLKEADLFTDTMNARIEFYRQLQAVSDMVGDYEGDKTERGLQVIQGQENEAQNRLSIAQGRHRYLIHLKEAESNTEEARFCVICRESFEIGVLTTCGHQFCKACISQWLAAHHNCPTCKTKLARNSLHDITLKPQELKVRREDTHTGAKVPHQTSPSKKTGIYAEFDPEQLAQIKNIDLDGPVYTTKVANLLRHILWLREHDPGAKAVVFSQYKDFLDVVGSAFSNYRIGYTSFEKAKGISSFRDDPGVEVFLLHARAHSSGLNLVNASHVFLCEPILNTALELQAIARVDRIGQQHETTVWLYIVEGTVEESIYNLSVRRRMEHMGRNLLKGKSKESTPELADDALEMANSLEMQAATSLSRLMGKGKISGEVVDKNDVWQCLFGDKTNVNGSRGQFARARDEWMGADPALAPFMAGAAAEGRRRGNGRGGVVWESDDSELDD
ncbi:SNF2 family N-terminal domain-containing protein [Coniochaeta sp. 2T2.1]|nr:SNF2 family N-terminal domain-containing protein [Coniochaeta sp. 2T2.1]